MIDITPIINSVIALVCVVITAIVIPYIKSKRTATEWSTICDWTSTAVTAAEVLYKGTMRGEEKRDYVLSFVQEKCTEKGYRYDAESVRIALEKAWHDMTSGGDNNGRK